MKNRLVFLLCLSLLFAFNLKGQDVRSLITEGLELNKTSNYAGAIEKFKAALAAEPANTTAKYQMAFALNSSGKIIEAIPFLQDVVLTSNSPAITLSSYSLLGSIYDRSGQPKKAIENYQKALQLDSANYGLLYGLGLAYFRDKQYKQAEQSAVKAMTIDPTKPESMRLYALVAFHQDKRAPALLGLCSFLYLDPNGSRSAEANENIDHILQGGVLKDASKAGRSSLSDMDAAPLNQIVSKAVSAVKKRSISSDSNLFNEELKAIFMAIGETAKSNQANNFFRTQLVGFYKQLAKSAHMQTFARYIQQQDNKSSAQWILAHPQQVIALKQWISDVKNPVIK
jgi:tetratricopeptide (TPR) repeat protein